MRETSDQNSLLARVEALERAALSSLTGLAALDQRLGLQYHEFASAIAGLGEELLMVRESTGAQVRRTAELDCELRDFQGLMQEEWWRLGSPKSNAGGCETLLGKGDSNSLNVSDLSETQDPVQKSACEVIEDSGLLKRPSSPSFVLQKEHSCLWSPRGPLASTFLHEDCVPIHCPSSSRVIPIQGMEALAHAPRAPDDDLHARLDRLSARWKTPLRSATDRPLHVPSTSDTTLPAAPQKDLGEIEGPRRGPVTVTLSATDNDLARSKNSHEQELIPISTSAPLQLSPSSPRKMKDSYNCQVQPQQTAKPSHRDADVFESCNMRTQDPVYVYAVAAANPTQMSRVVPPEACKTDLQEDDLLLRLQRLEKLVEHICTCRISEQRRVDRPEKHRDVCSCVELQDLRGRVEAAEKALLAAADKLSFLAHLVTARLGCCPRKGGA